MSVKVGGAFLNTGRLSRTYATSWGAYLAAPFPPLFSVLRRTAAGIVFFTVLIFVRLRGYGGGTRRANLSFLPFSVGVFDFRTLKGRWITRRGVLSSSPSFLQHVAALQCTDNDGVFAVFRFSILKMVVQKLVGPTGAVASGREFRLVSRNRGPSTADQVGPCPAP